MSATASGSTSDPSRYIDGIVDRAPSLTAEQIERLRGLLPPVEEESRASAR